MKTRTSLSLIQATLGYATIPVDMQTARDRILAACRKHGVAFLQGCTVSSPGSTRACA
jgi:4-hydroxy-2-oxoheptanedioate aldolase